MPPQVPLRCPQGSLRGSRERARGPTAPPAPRRNKQEVTRIRGGIFIHAAASRSVSPSEAVALSQSSRLSRRITSKAWAHLVCWLLSPEPLSHPSCPCRRAFH